MESDSKRNVRLNVLALLDRARPMRASESGVTRLKNLGVSHGNAQRTVDDQSDMQLATLDQIAAGLRVKPWQLLVEGLDPARLPSIEPAAARFSEAALKVAAIYDSATPGDRRHIDAIAQAVLSDTTPDEAEAATDAARPPAQSPKPVRAPDSGP